MRTLQKLVSATLLTVAMAVVVMLAVKPAPVEAKGGAQWWLLKDADGVEAARTYDSRKHALTYCGSTQFEHPIVVVEKVGTTRNICR